jgi:hypothetical protein
VRPSPRKLVLLAVATLSLTAAGFSGADFTASSANPNNSFATGDYVPPVIDASVVVPAVTGAPNNFVKKSGSYTLYASVSDQAQGSSGINNVIANLTSISGNGNNNVALSPCASNCTVGGTTYNYSVTKTASSTLTDGSKGYTINATDNAQNHATQLSASVTADSTGPTVATVLENADGTQASFIQKNTTYYVVANATDGGVGLDTSSVTANLSSLTGNGGDTAVALTTCSGSPSCTVGGTTYSYRAQFTTSAGLSDGAKSAPVSANDLLANTGSANAAATADSTGPTLTPIIERSGSAATTAVKKSTTYWVLLNATDGTGSGVDSSTLKTDVSNLTGNPGDNAVSLGSCASSGAPSCTVGGTTYSFAVQFTTSATLADGSTSYSVSGNDNLGNSTTTSPSVTADSTAPPDITDFAVIKDTAGGSPNFVAKSGLAFNTQKYVVYANVPADTGSGIGSVTADVHNITGNAGDTAVALSSTGCPCAVPGNTSKTYGYKSAQLTSASTLVDAATLSYSVVSADNAQNSSTAASANVTVDDVQPVTPTSGAISTVNNGSTAGKAESGDQLILKFTELNMDPFLILSGWDGTAATNITVSIVDKGGGGSNDGLTLGSTQLGAVDMGNSGYITTVNGTVNFTNSSMTISTASGVATVTITLGTPSTGTLGTVTGTPTATWTPSASATDKAGNTVATTARTMSTPMF